MSSGYVEYLRRKGGGCCPPPPCGAGPPGPRGVAGATGATGATGSGGPALFTLTTTDSNITFPTANSVSASPGSGTNFATTLEAYQSAFLTFFIPNDSSTNINLYGLSVYDPGLTAIDPFHFFRISGGEYTIYANGVDSGQPSTAFTPTTQFTSQRVGRSKPRFFFTMRLLSILAVCGLTQAQLPNHPPLYTMNLSTIVRSSPVTAALEKRNSTR